MEDNRVEEEVVVSDYNDFGEPVVVNMPKKKKTGFVIGVTVGAIFAVAAIVIVLFFVFRKTPYEAVTEAFNNSYGELVDKSFSPYEEIFGLSDFSDEDLNVVFDGTINSMFKEKQLSGITFNIEAQAKNSDNSTDMSLLSGFTKNGQTINANFYKIGDMLYQEMPEIYNAVFAYDMAALSNDSMESVDPEEMKAVRELYDKYMIPATEQLKNSIVYEKLDKEKITNANGDTIKCKKYLVTLPSEAVTEYVGAFSSFISEYTKTYMEDYIYDELNISKTQFDEIMSNIKTYCALIFPSDFKLYVYVDHKKLARTEFNYKFIMLGANVSFVVDYMGKDYVMRDVDGTVAFSYNNNSVEISFANRQEPSENKVTGQTELIISGNNSSLFSFSGSSEYDKSTGAYQLSSKINTADENSMCFDVGATINNIKKGESFDVDVKSVRAYDGKDEYFSFSGKATCSNLNKELAKPNLDNVVPYDEANENGGFSRYINKEGVDKISESWSESLIDDSEMEFARLNDEIELNLSKESMESSLYEQEMQSQKTKGTEEESQILNDCKSAEEADTKYASLDCADVTDNDAESSEIEIYSKAEDSITNQSANNVYLKLDEYEIAINEPEGFERGYAQEDGICIFNDDYNIYYYIYTDFDKDEFCKDLLSGYEEINNCVVDSQTEEVIKLSDGTEISCIVMKIDFDGSEITDIYYLFPLGDEDYVLCNTEIWDGDAELIEIADMFINTGIIEVR